MNGDALLEALAAGLRRRVAEQRRAEARLADFAFREAEPSAGPAAAPPSAASRSAAPAGTTAWRYYLLRTLRSAGEAETLALLEMLRDGPRPIAGLAVPSAAAPWAGDRVAGADWIGGLAAAGLVSRELETDRVALAPLGSALLDLVVELERRLNADPPADETATPRAGATAGVTT
ncbi:MAG: hypothetical protein ACOYXS_02990 [Chloroflexota bacterium]